MVIFQNFQPSFRRFYLSRSMLLRFYLVYFYLIRQNLDYKDISHLGGLIKFMHPIRIKIAKIWTSYHECRKIYKKYCCCWFMFNFQWLKWKKISVTSIKFLFTFLFSNSCQTILTRKTTKLNLKKQKNERNSF